MSEPKCETGCITFYGGEIRHDKNCAFYPESLSEMYAKLTAELESLRALVGDAKEITFPNGAVIWYADDGIWRGQKASGYTLEGHFNSAIEAYTKAVTETK